MFELVSQEACKEASFHCTLDLTVGKYVATTECHVISRMATFLGGLDFQLSNHAPPPLWHPPSLGAV